MDKIDNTNYETIRSKIKSGDALAWTHKGWKTWYDFQIQMVRAFSQSEYCHVGVAWVIGKRVFILESVGTGIRIYPLSLELPFYWIPIKKYWTKDIEEFALSKMGAKYSKWEGIQALFGKLKNGKDGIHTYCKECNSKRCKEYRSKNPEEGKLRARAWRENNKEKWDNYCKNRRLLDILKFRIPYSPSRYFLSVDV